jgi:hypothetical protein
MLRSRTLRTAWATLALLVGASATALLAQDALKAKQLKPVTIAEQGSFAAGGTVLTALNGDTFHGDHAYVQYQVPPDTRDLPLVMWHGGGQFSKTWETTPDGREGYQTIFLRRGFAVYILDQPRRGRAGRSTVGTTIPDAVPAESRSFNIFRLGIWNPPALPSFYPRVQFSRDPASLDQYYRQQTPSTGPGNFGAGIAAYQVHVNAVSALFDRTGPAVLLTHSASGALGWLTAIKNANVKAIIAYEPTEFVFPEGEVPSLMGAPSLGLTLAPLPVSPADFAKLTTIPIQIVYGDNIPTSPPSAVGLDLWYATRLNVVKFREAVNRHGGDASILYLPDVGVHGNTHFPFSDLNNLQVADLLSKYLHQKGLDRRTKQEKDDR